MTPTACLFAGATLGAPVVTPGVAVHTSGSQGSWCRFRPASLPVQQWKDPASIPLPDLGKVAKMLGISEGCSRGVREAKRATASVNLGAVMAIERERVLKWQRQCSAPCTKTCQKSIFKFNPDCPEARSNGRDISVTNHA